MKTISPQSIILVAKALAFSFILHSCSGSDNDEFDDLDGNKLPDFEVFEDGSSTEEIYNFGLSDSGIKFEYPFRQFNVDSSMIYFIGVKDEKIHLECFDYKTKANLLSWIENEKVESSLTIDLGYGNVVTRIVDNYDIQQAIYKDNNHILIVNETSEGEMLRSTIYFINNDIYKKESTFALRAPGQGSPIYYNRILDWFENSILVLPTDHFIDPNRTNHQNFCFTTGGELIYKSDIYALSVLFDNFHIINHEEMLTFSYQAHTDGDNYQWIFKRKNVKTNGSMWEVTLVDKSFLYKETKVNGISYSVIDENHIKCEISLVFENGDKGTATYKLNLADGTYENL